MQNKFPKSSEIEDSYKYSIMLNWNYISLFFISSSIYNWNTSWFLPFGSSFCILHINVLSCVVDRKRVVSGKSYIRADIQSYNNIHKMVTILWIILYASNIFNISLKEKQQLLINYNNENNLNWKMNKWMQYSFKRL